MANLLDASTVEKPNPLLDHYAFHPPMEQLKAFDAVMSKPPVDRIEAKKALMNVAINMIPLVNNLNKDLQHNDKLRQRNLITNAKWNKLMQAKAWTEEQMQKTIQFAEVVDPGWGQQIIPQASQLYHGLRAQAEKQQKEAEEAAEKKRLEAEEVVRAKEEAERAERQAEKDRLKEIRDRERAEQELIKEAEREAEKNALRNRKKSK